MMLPEEILGALRGMNLLVTGGTGAVGRHVVSLALDAGASVRVVSLDDSRPHPAARYVHADLTDAESCRDSLRGMDAVVHLAATGSPSGIAARGSQGVIVPLRRTNANLLDASREAGVRKFVYASPIGAPPTRAELRDGLELEAFSAIRVANVYGPGDHLDAHEGRLPGCLLERVLAGENPVVIGADSEAVGEFAYGGDVAEGILRALHYGTRGEVVNVGAGQGTTIRQLAETLCEIVPFRFVFDPSRDWTFARHVMDLSRAREQLGYEPRTSLREGLEATWRWSRDHDSAPLIAEDFQQSA